VSFPLPYSSQDLTGQVALVTGASVGLGRRFALTLAAAGADVAVAARRVDKLKELAVEIEALGRRCVPVALDMTDADQIVAAVQTAEEALGTVTILVNNAGITDAMRAHKMPLELIDSLIDTNIRGPYVLSCEVARRLIAAKKPGRMVNLSSMGAYNYGGQAAATLYSVSKAAMVRMTEVLAVEWVRYGINVNAIAPGLINSEMTDGMISRIGDFSGSFPRKRIGDPAQLDSTLLYLCAPSSEFVTGTIVKVDDGQGPR
jgi:NAD(P)-dependent dehydrogenase (short-subunit alcohol dehydrogenase family)